MAHPAGVPERPKGAGCKPAGSAYEGSNPSPCIVQPSAPRSNPRGAGRAGERGRALPLTLTSTSRPRRTALLRAGSPRRPPAGGSRRRHSRRRCARPRSRTARDCDTARGAAPRRRGGACPGGCRTRDPVGARVEGRRHRDLRQLDAALREPQLVPHLRQSVELEVRCRRRRSTTCDDCCPLRS